MLDVTGSQQPTPCNAVSVTLLLPCRYGTHMEKKSAFLLKFLLNPTDKERRDP